MGRHMGSDTKCKIMVLHTGKKGITSISKIVHRPKATIGNFIKRYELRSSLKNDYKSNKPKALQARTLRRLARLALNNRKLTARQLCDLIDTTASPQTIRNQLRKMGIRSRRPIKKPKLRTLARKIRLEWALEHQGWTVDDWKTVLFSDEKKLNMIHGDGNARVWMRDGEDKLLIEDCIEKTVKFGGGSVMIWGAIAWNGLRILELVENPFTASQYCRILENNVREAFNEYHDLKEYQEDNDPKHGGPRGAKLTKKWFQDNTDIPRMEWPPCSPDLNPIENLWHRLQMNVTKVKNRTKENLFEIANKIWGEIPTEAIRDLIESIPRRINSVIKANGGYTKY